MFRRTRRPSLHIDAETVRQLSQAHPDAMALSEEADRATRQEHSMSLWEAIRLYPRAVIWSIILSMAVVMEGFDVVLLANLFAFPPFQRHFGEQLPDGSWQITAPWQAGLSNGAMVGEILGLVLNGWVADRLGYRKTMIGSLILVVAFIFIIFFAQSLPMLLVGEILVGIPWGVFQTLPATYASEVCPTQLRAYLTTYVNLCWVFGQLIASGVLRAMLQYDTEMGFRIPFALQWMWPVPLIIGVYFAPESPWWLVRKGRLDDAKESLRRLTSRNESFNADEIVSMMRHTDELEKSVQSGMSYWDCFKGTDRRRTEIVCCTWAVQIFCGSSFMGFSTYFYEQAGMDVSNAFNMSLAQYALGAVGTLLSWCFMTRFGRRTLYMTGQLAMSLLLLIIGCVAFAGRENVPAQWAIGSMLLAYTFAYDSTVGPVCYSLVTELSSTRLKTKSVVLARNVYNVAGIAANIITPHMLNPGAWNLGAKSGFFWAACCFACFVWTYFRLPEPKGRTYGEIDIMFACNVPARKFKGTKIDGLGFIEEVSSETRSDEAEEKRTKSAVAEV